MNNSEMNNKFFQKLIERYLEGKTTAGELKLLINYYDSFQKENAWVEALGPENLLKERMLINILEAIKEEDSLKTKIISLFRTKIVKYSSVAASVAILIGLTYFQFTKQNKQDISTSNSVANSSINIGTNKAILTREDGSNIVIGEGENITLDNVVSNGEEIVYSQNTNATSEIAYNYLTIPRGGQFSLKLADGTEVWLNSESKLKYPVAFASNKPRMVELLHGEAYFKVSPSKLHQGAKFIVNNNNHEIEVLGTEFNLKAYRDEANITTTLVHGKVNINYLGKAHILLPNQQSVLDRNTNTISFKSVDVFHEISWKNGIFSFNDKSLKDIMTVLSRWYDFETVFKNSAVANEKFVGVLGKKNKIENILQNLKTLGVITNYKIENKNIFIE